MQKQQTTLQNELTPQEQASLQQSVTQDQQRALQEGTPDTTKSVQAGIAPNYPAWPTSKPGPQSTPPPTGMRPATPLRSEQMIEIAYQSAHETFASVPASTDTEEDFNSPKKPKERL